MIKKVLLSGSAICATVALSSSLAFASSISTTGKNSINLITSNSFNSCVSVNTNNTAVVNLTGQLATTGNATVNHNTTGGSAKTGNAHNGSTNGTTLNVTNKGACGNSLSANNNTGLSRSISKTGQNSVNVIGATQVSSAATTNTNNTLIGGLTLQGAQSGNASVSNNTKGGSAVSGPSLNTSGNTTKITVTND